MGVPLLLMASVLIGGIAALEARRANNLISASTLHLVWSTEMAFCCQWLSSRQHSTA